MAPPKQPEDAAARANRLEEINGVLNDMLTQLDRLPPMLARVNAVSDQLTGLRGCQGDSRVPHRGGGGVGETLPRVGTRARGAKASKARRPGAPPSSLVMSAPREHSSCPRDCPTMDSLEKQLLCPICLEVFTKPVVILPCQHNLCRKCAKDLFQSRGTTLGTAGRFRCPSCRHEVVLDRHGIYGLQRNLLVENIIDIYKQASARGPERSLSKTEHPICEEHEEERINIYCVTCGVPTCSLCKVFGEHKDCEVAPLSDIYIKQKAELTDGIGALMAANDRIQVYVSALQDTSRNIEDNCKAQKQALCEKFDRMCVILEERRKIMLQRIAYEQEEKTQHLKSLTKVCSDHIESSSKLMDTALQSMEEPQMAVFVQNANVLVRKISEMSQSCKLDALESGYDNMDHYTVDFNAEERVLYQLDFVKVEEEPELMTDEDGACGETEDPSADSEAGAAEGGEDPEGFFAFGKEEQASGGALMMNEGVSCAAGGEEGQATPPPAPSGTECQVGTEDGAWAPLQNPAPDPAADGGRNEEIIEPLLSSWFSPTLWLHD